MFFNTTKASLYTLLNKYLENPIPDILITFTSITSIYYPS